MSYLDQVNLSSYTFDLGIERRDQLWQVSGQLLYVFSVDGEIYVKVNDQNSALIDLRIARIIRIPFERLYLTNPAQTGKNCVIVISNILTIPEPVTLSNNVTLANPTDNIYITTDELYRLTLTNSTKDAIAKAHTQNTDTALAPLTANINANSYKITNLGVPTSIGDSIRVTSIITEANLEDAINKKHTQNTDQYLDYGGANQSSASDIYTVIGRVNQDLKTTASPTFAGLTVDTNTLYIDNVNHRVGIKTSSPSQSLTVAGNIGLQSGADALIGTLDNYALSLITNNTNRVFISSSGNVGVGTTTPQTLFHVAGKGSFGNSVSSSLADRALNLIDTNAVMKVYRINSDTYSPAIELVHDTGSGINAYWDIYTLTSNSRNAMVFRSRYPTDNTYVLTADVNKGIAIGDYKNSIPPTNGIIVPGNIGIGTTSPTAKLHISSNVIRLDTSKTPSSATDIGNQGDICWDSNYLYICIATNTWKRVALSSW